MGAFARDLNVGKIIDHVRQTPGGAVASLFENWVVAGERPHREGRLGLRLAVRNGYVNFYASGQSVAKLCASQRKFEVETHWKYHQGVKNGAPAAQIGGLYPRFREAELGQLSPEDVSRWTRTAETYASAEKSFVERLVVSNSNVVDLETALPGETAPRMDLAVVSERGGDLVIGFWEAKCIDNKELRASTLHEAATPTAGPKVFRQVRAYADWLSNSDQREDLRKAYQRTGQIIRGLVDGLLDIDEARYGQLRKMDHRIRDLAERLPDVVVQPGLVVGTRCRKIWLRGRPNPEKDIKRFSDNLRSYRIGEDSHEARIQRHIANYVCVETGGMHKLPELVS
jgi:hypothetical protein